MEGDVEVSLTRRVLRHSATLRRIAASAAELDAALKVASRDVDDDRAPDAILMVWQEPPLAEMASGSRALSLHWVAWQGRLRLGLRISLRGGERDGRQVGAFLFRKRHAVRLARLAMAALLSERERRAEFVASLEREREALLARGGNGERR